MLLPVRLTASAAQHHMHPLELMLVVYDADVGCRTAFVYDSVAESRRGRSGAMEQVLCCLSVIAACDV
jgi:hypothetical protein